jgi:DNA-binding transcriptional LysR family regulator
MTSDLWPGLDLRHLAAFAAVAQSRSFGRAAEALGYTQSAVSQQVAALEKIVGQRLFDRSSGRSHVALTEAGEILFGHVEALKVLLVAARQDLSDLQRGEVGTLRVGAFQSALARIAPRILHRYGEIRAGVKIELVESSDDLALLAGVRDSALDFAFALLPLDEDALEYRELVRDGFVLISKRGKRASKRPESLNELSGIPMILYRTCRSAAVLLAQLELHMRDLKVAFRSDDNAAIKEMVRAGVGVAILPELWTETGGNEGLELIPLNHLLPPRVVVLAWRKDRHLTPAQTSFIDVASAAYPERRLVRVAN